MNKEEFYLLNRAYNKRIGRSDVMYGESHLNKNAKAVNEELVQKGYVDENGEATVEGISQLEPYKVDNAVILAAGAATRFVPLSLEKPKGLYKVRNECIIERQIKQLKSAGINDITLVLGYKKEMFFYLKDKYDVKFIFNGEFNSKNNTYSLYLAKDELKNTYVCSSDDYFVQNPFQRYEYQSFYAGYHVNKKTNEMYVDVDDNGQVTKMAKGLDQGNILLGQSFWTKAFSDKMVSLLKADQQVGVYDNMFWEWVVKDNLTDFPPFYFGQVQNVGVN